VATCAAVTLTGGASAKKQPEDPNKVVRRIEASSGTRIVPPRICRTRAEWRAEQDDLRQEAEQGVGRTWDRAAQEALRNTVPGAPVPRD
jgi:hypothetical protein